MASPKTSSSLLEALIRGTSSSSSSSSPTASNKRSAVILAVLFAVLLRCAMFSLPHSGQQRALGARTFSSSSSSSMKNSNQTFASSSSSSSSVPSPPPPPLNPPAPGGDFEAQRHWMEITTNIPSRDWYRNTGNNDLLYWGLDYPPFTAYVSWFFGTVASWNYMVPQLVELHTSRMYEDGNGKLFMRLTVLVCDLVVYIPAVLALMYVLPWNQQLTRRPHVETTMKTRIAVKDKDTSAVTSSSSSMKTVYSLLLVLLHPALLIIDHGHFQYNNMSLGLTLAAVAAIANDRYLLASFLFSLSLNFKQMSLYYAPVFFVFLLNAAYWKGGLYFIRKELVVVSMKSPRTLTRVQDTLLGVFLLAMIVLLTFGILWFPFCYYTLPILGGCEAGVQRVLGRLFPLTRNIFEDKVSNLWCALEPLTKFRQRLSDIPLGPHSGHSTISIICMVTTLTLSLPSLALLFQAWFSSSSSIDNNKKHVFLETDVVSTMEATATMTNTSGIGSNTKRRRAGSKSVVVQAPSIPPKTLPTTATTTNTPVRASSKGKRSQVPSPMPTAVNEAQSSSSSLSSQSFFCLPLPPPSLTEHFLLCLFLVALAFFLGAYQVHEKSILLAALPLATLHHRFPLFSTWFAVFSTWTMWPLLQRDGLLTAAVALCVLYLYISHQRLVLMRTKEEEEVGSGYGNRSKTSILHRLGQEEAAILQPLNVLFFQSSSSTPQQEEHGQSQNLRYKTQQQRLHTICILWFVCVTPFIAFVLNIASIYIPAPGRLPDIHPYLSAVFGAGCLLIALVFGILLQVGWIVRSVFR